MEVLSDKAKIPYGTIEKWYYDHEHSRSVDFNVADRVLGATRLWNWWYTRFAAYYDAVDLAWAECECPGCEKMIHRIDQPAACISCGTTEKKVVARGLCAACTQFHKYHGSLEQFPKLGRSGGRQSDYCSSACREAHGRMKRGESASGERMKVRSTHCRRGHLMTKENTKIRRNGKRECRECHRVGSRVGYHRRRAAALAA